VNHCKPRELAAASTPSARAWGKFIVQNCGEWKSTLIFSTIFFVGKPNNNFSLGKLKMYNTNIS
jgi:hypothetical protein